MTAERVLLDERSKIDFAAVEKHFPMLVAGFGKGDLRQQVETHNRLLEQGHEREHSATFFAYLMKRERISSPHIVLLNLLSLWHSSDLKLPRARSVVARLFLLERHLAAVKRAGEEPTGYRDMLHDPEALDRLIAELDVAAPFAWAGRFRSHVPTNLVRGNRNYDVDWNRFKCRVRCDVKWFETWFMKRRGSKSLQVLLSLIRPDIKHMICVSLDRRPYSDAMLVDAAAEVLALYDGALADPSLNPDIVVDGDDEKRVALRPRKTFPQKSTIGGVRDVTVYLARDTQLHQPFIVSEVGVGAVNEDVNVVRRCLQDAASQVPRAQSRRDLSAIVVGSLNPQDGDDVKSALWGSPRINATTNHIDYEPGFFSPETGERTLDHVQAVYYYSLGYSDRRSSEVVVRRYVRLFLRDRGLSIEQHLLARLARYILGRKTVFEVRAPNEEPVTTC